jgi:ATP-binding cassette subfamily F protein 3
MAKVVLHVSGGQLTRYAGDYQYYLDKTKATSERAALTANGNLGNYQPSAMRTAAPTSGGGAKSKEQKRLEAEARNARSKRKRELEAKIEEAESRLEAIEKRKGIVELALQDPATFADPALSRTLQQELDALSTETHKKTSEWEKAAAELEQLTTTPA